jgi:hypothetical protein
MIRHCHGCGCVTEKAFCADCWFLLPGPWRKRFYKGHVGEEWIENAKRIIEACREKSAAN